MSSSLLALAVSTPFVAIMQDQEGTTPSDRPNAEYTANATIGVLDGGLVGQTSLSPLFVDL